MTVEAPSTPPTTIVISAGRPSDQLPALANAAVRAALSAIAGAVKVLISPPFAWRTSFSPATIRASSKAADEAVVAGVSAISVLV